MDNELKEQEQAFKEMSDFALFVMNKRTETHGNFIDNRVKKYAYGLGELCERMDANIGNTIAKNYKKISPDENVDLICYATILCAKLKTEMQRHPLWEEFKGGKK